MNLTDLLKQSKHAVVFTGAGMSTESGIPDYRGTNGLWKDIDPIALSSTTAVDKHYDEFVDFYRSRIHEVLTHGPNKGHEILAKWLKQGTIQSIITQNVDGYHGLANKSVGLGDGHRIYELHGSLRYCYCQTCGCEFPIKEFMLQWPRCTVCMGKMRPSVVLFDEALDLMTLGIAQAEAINCDLFIVLGSSLQVSPANDLPIYALQNGAKLVIVNYDQTEFDNYAYLSVHSQPITKILELVDAGLCDLPSLT